MKMALVKLALATGVGVVTLAACGSANDGFDPTVPTTLEYVSGSGQSAHVGEPLDNALIIRTTNFDGDPVSGVSVQWEVITGQGTVSSGNTVTDVNGMAEVSWVLGSIVGEQKVQAIAALTGSPVTFTAAASAASGGGGGGGATP